MSRKSRESLREARAVATVARDLAQVIQSYLDDPQGQLACLEAAVREDPSNADYSQVVTALEAAAR